MLDTIIGSRDPIFNRHSAAAGLLAGGNEHRLFYLQIRARLWKGSNPILGIAIGRGIFVVRADGQEIVKHYGCM